MEAFAIPSAVILTTMAVGSVNNTAYSIELSPLWESCLEASLGQTIAWPVGLCSASLWIVITGSLLGQLKIV